MVSADLKPPYVIEKDQLMRKYKNLYTLRGSSLYELKKVLLRKHKYEHLSLRVHAYARCLNVFFFL